MLYPYLITILGIALTWLVLGLASLGVGLLLRRLFRLGPLDRLGLCVAFWTGWAAIVALLQIWHLALPVNRVALILTLIIGATGLLLEARPLAGLAREGVRRAPVLVILLIPTLLWMANRSTGPAQFYDLGLYYLQAVQWNSNYPIVPGLGNLHGRLAFNSAYFLYGALVDQVPFAAGAVHTANGLLLFALLAQSVAAIAALAAGARLPRFAFWNSLTVAPVLYLISGLEGGTAELPVLLYLHGLAPDLPVLVLGLVLAGLCLVLLLEVHALAPGEHAYLCFALALLACVGVAVKLSFVAFALIALVVGLGVTLWRQRQARRAWLALLAPPLACALLVGGVWMARGVILSGYPAYPSTLGAFPVPWRVPTALALSEANWVRSWSRQRDLHWSVVLGNWAWLRPWLATVPSPVLRPLNLALVGGLLGAATLGGSRLPWRQISLATLWLLPALVALVFWFFSAPDYRFAGAVFWVLGLGLMWLAVEGVAHRLAGGPPPVAVRLAVVALVLLFVAPVRPPLLLAGVAASPDDGLPPLLAPPYTPVTTISGLSLLVPVGTNQCWALPLPCTPYVRPELRLREPGNLAGGFILDATREYVDIHGSDLPLAVSAPANLGVALPSGWYDYEAEHGVRWMQDEGMILLYSDVPRRLRLTLHPSRILGSAGLQHSGKLLVSVEGVPVVETNVQVGEVTELSLAIKAGFSRVTLTPEWGAHKIAEVLGVENDGRYVSLALSTIGLSDE